MKKLFALIFTCLLFVFSFTACQNSSQNENTNIKQTEISNNAETASYPEEFRLVNMSTTEKNDKKIDVTVFANIEVDSDGLPVSDDSQDWLLIAKVGEKHYTLLSKKALQLGLISADTFIDENDKTLHILAKVKDSGSYKIIDFCYNDETEKFISEEVYSKDNITSATTVK